MNTITNLNAHALANTAKQCASMANSVSGTIKSIVIHWNLCCQQAQMEGFTTEARYTRRAHLAADMLRMAEQLMNIAYGRDALTAEPRIVDVMECHEVMVQDIQVGDVVVLTDRNEAVEIVAVHDFSCYFDIEYKSVLGTERYDRGETLLVCGSNKFHGEREAHRINESINNEGNAMTTTINFTSDVNVNEFFKLASGDVMLKTNNDAANAINLFTGERRNIEPNAPVFECGLSPMGQVILLALNCARTVFHQPITINEDTLFYSTLWMESASFGERHMGLLAIQDSQLASDIYNVLDCVQRINSDIALSITVLALKGMLALGIADDGEEEVLRDELSEAQERLNAALSVLDPAGLGREHMSAVQQSALLLIEQANA